MSAVDLHQHLWPEPFVELLRRRTHAPCLRGWTLVTDGEPAYEIRPADHDVDRRIEQDLLAGIDLACVSLSAPLGIEALPRDEASDLLEAWHAGALDLPEHFSPWASVPAAEPDLSGLAALLSGRCVGVQLPATAVGGPAGWEALSPVLRVAELSDKPVFVHPGPSTPAPGVPSWWPPVVGYVAQLQAAWWAWHAFDGRAQFPRLRLVFAAGAGLAPVHHERMTARGGRLGEVDPAVFVDTSSYGTQGLDALARALGIDVLVLGSDRPYAEPLASLLGDAATQAVRVDNPRRALGLDVGTTFTPSAEMGPDDRPPVTSASSCSHGEAPLLLVNSP